MKTVEQKTKTIIAAIIIALIYIPFVFAIGGGGSLGESWEVNPRVTSTNLARAEFGVFALSYEESEEENEENGQLYSVYVNLASVSSSSNGAVEFTFDFLSSQSSAEENSPSYTGASRKNGKIENAEEKLFKWVKVCDEIGGTPKFVRIGTQNAVTVNEIVFADKNGKTLDSEFYGSVGWQKGAYGFSSAEYLAKNGLLGQAGNALDAQTFDCVSSAENFSSSQAELMQAVDSFFSGGSFVRKSGGPLSVLFACAGRAIFGRSLLGLNFFNYLLNLLAIYALYFFACRRGGWLAGAGAAAMYFFIGVGFSATVASCASVTALPFALIACLCSFAFFNSAAGRLDFKKFLPAILCGGCLALALAADVRALALAIAVIGCFIAGCVKTLGAYSGYKNQSGVSRILGKEKFVRAATLVAVTAVLGFALLPVALLIACYAAGFVPYARAYIDLNGDLFAIAFANMGDQLSIKAGISGIVAEGSRGFGLNYAVVGCNLFATLSVVAAVVVGSVLLIKENKKTEVDGGARVSSFTAGGREAFVFAAICALSSLIGLLFTGVCGISSFVYPLAFLALAAVFAVEGAFAKNERVTGITVAVCSAVCIATFALVFCDIAALNVYPSPLQTIAGFFGIG